MRVELNTHQRINQIATPKWTLIWIWSLQNIKNHSCVWSNEIQILVAWIKMNIREQNHVSTAIKDHSIFWIKNSSIYFVHSLSRFSSSSSTSQKIHNFTNHESESLTHLYDSWNSIYFFMFCIYGRVTFLSGKACERWRHHGVSFAFLSGYVKN